MALIPQDGWELGPEDELYPASLRELEESPKIYGRGDPAVLLGPCLSIIGARRATPYGLACAELAGRIAAECSICVVSGGAMGCDAQAGRAALDAGGKTVVVSALGADLVYPASSRDVFEGALKSGGAVVSLVPWGTEARKSYFVRRNRIIAALGHALFVCEAGLPSGTLITAEQAVSLGKTVYAIPGSIFSEHSRGTNHLIELGSAIICDEQSLESHIALDFNALRLVSEDATPDRGIVLSALVASPVRPEELATRLGLDVLTVIRTLTEYESRGLAQRLYDGRYMASQDALVHRRGKVKT